MNASTSRWISGVFLTALGPLPAIRGGQNFVCERVAAQTLKRDAPLAAQPISGLEARALGRDRAKQAGQSEALRCRAGAHQRARSLGAALGRLAAAHFRRGDPLRSGGALIAVIKPSAPAPESGTLPSCTFKLSKCKPERNPDQQV